MANANTTGCVCNVCGARSSDFFIPANANDWMRSHADSTGHSDFALVIDGVIRSGL